MLIKKWDDIPDFLKNNSVKSYYDILSRRKFSLFSKRLFDIIVSFVMLLCLSPVLLFLMVWIKVDSKGPAIYKQERITTYGRVFKIYKFRTMVVNADKIGSLITMQSDERITKVGRKIRKSRLDELPQLMNILRGEMSFVGTRPEVKKYVDQYTDEMKATLLLPAGVTSLASINFRNEDEFIAQYKGQDIDEVYMKKTLPIKMKYNLDYLRCFSIVKDLIICMKTVI